MDIAEYHKMHALERNYWWFQGRRRIILTMLEQVLNGRVNATKPRILDIGCGTGMLLEDLEKLGFAAGLDFSTVALEYCRNRGLRQLGRADVKHIPVASNMIDLITALDLVEHIEDDVNVMNEFFRVLKPGGIAVMSVPAHKQLWSNHDLALHHFRRYEKTEFRALVEGAGFQVQKFSYSIAVAYFPAMVFRRIKRALVSSQTPHTDEFRLPWIVNTTLRKAVHLEAKWLKRHSLPFGLSLLCIARKPGGPTDA